MEAFINFFKKPFIRRIFILICIFAVSIWLRDMLSIFLMTFMLIYIGNSLQKLISRICFHFFKRRPNPRVIIVIIYALAIFAMVLFFWIYIPLVIHQITYLISGLSTYFKNPPSANSNTSSHFSITSIVSFVSSHVNISKYMESGGATIASFLTNIGSASVNIFLSIILSLFFLLGKNSVHTFLRQFKDSKLHWLYGDIRYFVYKFSNTFGKVIQTQLIISAINALISMCALIIMHFPAVFGLTAMIFVLGMIPVAGVFVSLVPLSIIGYVTGGISKVIWVLVLIAVLHALEGYVLNPRLMSNATRLPVFITFLILLVSEHVVGLWGLIIGIPIVVFLLDILDVLPRVNHRKQSPPSKPVESKHTASDIVLK